MVDVQRRLRPAGAVISSSAYSPPVSAADAFTSASMPKNQCCRLRAVADWGVSWVAMGASWGGGGGRWGERAGDYNSPERIRQANVSAKIRYESRASAVAQTRERIVAATLELHGEQGIAATSWDDIAARAGVGVGTVYRHFPSLDELIPACGEIAPQSLALPDPATRRRCSRPRGRPSASRGWSGGVRDLRARSAAVRAMRHETGVHPGVAQAYDALEASLGALVDAALDPLDGATDRAVARAMVDLGTWEALRDQGLEPDEAVAAVSGMLAA